MNKGTETLLSEIGVARNRLNRYGDMSEAEEKNFDFLGRLALLSVINDFEKEEKKNA